jgi:ELWxxDGT repeat protein
MRAHGPALGLVVVVLSGHAEAALQTSSPRLVATFACPGPRELTALGERMVFVADDGLAGQELWATSGTAATTARVRDIRPGAAASAPQELMVFGSRVLFSADDGVNGRELWVSDGTEAGTVLLADVRPGAESSSPTAFAVVGTRAYFLADDGVHGLELWITDGTPSGTRLVADLAPGPESSSLGQGLAAGPLLVFPMFAPGGHRLWRSDGTAAGTFDVMALDAFQPELSTGPRAFFTMGGVPCDGIFVTDGTTAGSRFLDGGCPHSIDAMVAFGHDVFYSFTNDELAQAVVRLRAGTFETRGIAPGRLQARAGPRLFLFGHQWDEPPILRTSDGTAHGTRDVGPIPASSSGGDGARDLFVWNVGPSNGAQQPWISDGTAAGTHPVAGAVPAVSHARYVIAGLSTMYAAFDGTCPLAAFDIPASPASAEDADALESAGAAVFTVRLAEPSPLTATIAYATADATARAGSDYVATAGTVTIPAGATTATVSVPLIADGRDETNEVFLLTLSSPSNARLGRATAQAVIRDDDGRASLGTPIAVLPYTITRQGRYSLARNLAMSIPAGVAITIASDFVFLDLGGFKIGGGAAGPETKAYGIHALGRRNITVKGGLVTGFAKGIFLEDEGGRSGAHVVDSVAVENSRDRGIHVQGAGSLVRRSRVIATGGTASHVAGIELEGALGRVLDNDVLDTRVAPPNPDIALQTAAAIHVRSAGVVVERNRVAGNGESAAGTTTYGIRATHEPDAMILRNRITAVASPVAFTDGAIGTDQGNLISP